MAYKPRLDDTEMACIWQSSLDDSDALEDVSETENEILNDDNQSDIEDELVNEDIPPCEEHSQASSNFTFLSDRRVITVSRPTIRSKSKHCWSTSKGNNFARDPSMNAVQTSKGSTRECKSIYDPISCFNMFFTDLIISEIVQWTNVEISLNCKNGMTSATFVDTNAYEIRALIGLLALSAALKDSHLSTDDLFNTIYSGTQYTAIMSRDRFDFLMRCLRMDDKTLRTALQPNDAFLPVRNIWELFIKQCQTSYIPGSHTTIDEHLLGFRGRCPFKIYIPNKPIKYGIKILMMCDSSTKYIFNAIPYLGKTTKTCDVPLDEYYVKKLSRPVHGTWRNITCDSSLTSVPLAKSLLKEPYKLTIVGAIRSSKREIPEEIKNLRTRQLGTTMFCYDGSLTLLSYKPKNPSKMVYLLSSRNEKGTIDDRTGKPNIMLYYNETKGGSDTFDQLSSLMSCSRKTNRWPMAVFYGILNMAFMNSYVIYCHNMISIKRKPLSRKEYMKELSNSLSTPWMKKRVETSTLSRTLRKNIQNGIPNESSSACGSINTQNVTSDEVNNDCVSGVSKKKRYCGFCPSKIRRMSKMSCVKCDTPLCGDHKNLVCDSCM